MKIQGQCHCGAIAYEAEVNPDTVSICHCTDCQHLSGAPYRASVPAKAENLAFTKGKPKTYVKTAESGNKRAQGFCENCGTQLYSTNGEGKPEFYMLRLGPLKQREELIPVRQIWTKSALPWTYHIDALENLPGNAPMLVKK